eukprot:TRINITY_DN597_c1_g2_i1.p1 TRINITY_DN597_c1_g2~~TRINITY_DN597_c1_g2_i1.p1  ORF type:complete len:246 (-),score=29.39 TRINITY_DN597_c1_g2_i1:207-944(-)
MVINTSLFRRIGQQYNQQQLNLICQQICCYSHAPLAHIWDIPIPNRDGEEKAELRQRSKAEWPIADSDGQFTRNIEAFEVIGQKFSPQEAQDVINQNFIRSAQLAHAEHFLQRYTNSQFVLRNKQMKTYMVKNQDDKMIYSATGYIYSAEFVVKEVMKRIEAPRAAPPRKIVQQVLKDAANAEGVKGCQIEINGILGKRGGRSSKMVKLWGKYPFTTFSEKVDWAVAHALTPKGLIGVQAFITYD